MSTLTVEHIRAYLARHPVSGLVEPLRIEPESAGPEEQRFLLRSANMTAALIVYTPGAADKARRAAAGQQLGGEMSLSTPLLAFDEAGTELGGPTMLAQAPTGVPLGDRALTDEEVTGWLFLLLTLHHLSPARVTVVSSMSQDAATWWQRSQTAWSACQAAYAGPAYQPLLKVLMQLHAIVGVRIETHRDLWQGVQRRPCHGNPVPAYLVKEGSRLALVEWEGFGLGDPAIEVGRIAALAALSGELTGDQYIRFMSDYLDGMRDVRDATLEERMRVFASVLPLGFCFTVLDLLARQPVPPDERERILEQVARALLWVQDTMGVEIGDPAGLLAPLRVSAGRTA
jgi:thiamine kinase-like enzyme